MNCGAVVVLALLAFLQGPAPALPPVEGFKSSVWQIIDAVTLASENLQSKSTPVDGGELLQYTYTETETHTNLDSQGKPGRTETNVYHVTRGPEEWQFYRKLITRNGVALPAAELEKQDAGQREKERKQREQVARQAEKREREARRQSAGKPPEVRTPEQERKYKDDALFAFYSSIYTIKIVRRETVDGHNTVLMSLVPKPEVKPTNAFLKVLQHVSLRGWITEDGHHLLRMEADVIDTISLGMGMLARFKEGSKMALDRRPISDSTWGPVRVEGTVSARILLLKGMHERQVSQYSDFHRFAVETSLKVIEVAPSE